MFKTIVTFAESLDHNVMGNGVSSRHKGNWKGPNDGYQGRFGQGLIRTTWTDEDLGGKVKYLLESNAHRRDAVILPNKCDIIRPHQDARRSSAQQNPNPPIRLAFMGDREHKNWMKEKNNNISLRSKTEKKTQYYHGTAGSSSSEYSFSEWKQSNTNDFRPRPKIIVNWLKDLQLLISSDESDAKINSDSSPVFMGIPPSTLEEPIEDLMVSSDIPKAREPAHDPNGDASVMEESTYAFGTALHNPNINRKATMQLELGKRESSSIMRVASRLEVVPNPALIQKYSMKKRTDREIDSHSQMHSPSSSSDLANSTSDENRKLDNVPLSRRKGPVLSHYDTSSDSSSHEQYHQRPKKKIRYSRMPRSGYGLRSSSYSAMSREKMAVRKYNEDCKRIDTADWEHENFDKALENSLRHHRRCHQNRGNHHRRPAGLENFWLAPPYGNDCRCRRAHGDSMSSHPSPRFTHSPPSYEGFDPYVEPDCGCDLQWDSGLSLTPCYDYGRPSCSNHRYREYDSLPKSRSNDLYSNHMRRYSSRLWQKNHAQMMKYADSCTHPAEGSGIDSHSRHRHDDRNRGYDIWSSEEMDVKAFDVRHTQSARPESFLDGSEASQRRPRSHHRHAKHSRPSMIRQDSFDEPRSRPHSNRLSRPRDGSNSRKSLARKFSTSTSLSEIDPILENKMNSMVKDFVYGSRPDITASAKRLPTSNEPVKLQSKGSVDAIGAIHERVAAALASVLMEKTLPRHPNKNK